MSPEILALTTLGGGVLVAGVAWASWTAGRERGRLEERNKQLEAAAREAGLMAEVSNEMRVEGPGGLDLDSVLERLRGGEAGSDEPVEVSHSPAESGGGESGPEAGVRS